jgi:hypothetical protein
LCDDADAAVTADCGVEEVWIFFWRSGVQGSIGEEDVDFSDGPDEGAFADIASVDIDAEGSADGEVGVGLHDPDGEAMRVDLFLDLSPSGAGLDGDGACFVVEMKDLVQTSEIDVKGVRVADLAALAESSASERDGAMMGEEGCAEFLDGGWGCEGCDGRGVESCDVVDDVGGRGRWVDALFDGSDFECGGAGDEERGQSGDEDEPGSAHWGDAR